MNKHKSEVSTLLQNIVTKPVAIIALKFEWQCLKRHTGKAGLWPYGLDAWTLHTWTLDFWTLDDWTLGLWTTGLLDSGQLDAWTLDGWTLELWTLGVKKFFPFLVTSVSFLLLVNVEFLIFSGTLRSMYYGSVERAANHCYNSNLLQFILQLIL